jgi:hypothetical protein
MKTKNKLYAVTLLILLLSAVFVSAVSADTLEPWEEEFLEEYGEYWMYEDYGNQWFEYFLYEGNDEERYNELSLMYQNLAAQNAVPSNSVLEPWEERFLLEYGEDWMYEDLENFDKSWIYLNYGVNWFEYYLDEGEDELYNTLLQMYEEQKAQNTVQNGRYISVNNHMFFPFICAKNRAHRSQKNRKRKAKSPKTQSRFFLD